MCRLLFAVNVFLNPITSPRIAESRKSEAYATSRNKRKDANREKKYIKKNKTKQKNKTDQQTKQENNNNKEEEEEKINRSHLGTLSLS